MLLLEIDYGKCPSVPMKICINMNKKIKVSYMKMIAEERTFETFSESHSFEHIVMG